MEGLAAMESWMKELGLVMNTRELSLTEAMIDGIVASTLLLSGGYRPLVPDDVRHILRESLNE